MGRGLPDVFGFVCEGVGGVDFCGDAGGTGPRDEDSGGRVYVQSGGGADIATENWEEGVVWLEVDLAWGRLKD